MQYLHCIPTIDVRRSFVLAKKSHSRASWRSVRRCRIRSKYSETVFPLVGGVVVVEAVGGAVDAVSPAAGAGPIGNRDGRDDSVGSGGSLTVPVTSGRPGSVLGAPLLLSSSARRTLIGDARDAARRSLAANSVEVSMGGELAMVTVTVRGRCSFVRVSVPIGLSHLVSPRDSLLGSAGRTWARSLETPRSLPQLRGLPVSLVLVPRLSPSRWRRYHWCSSLQRGQSRRPVPGRTQL